MHRFLSCHFVMGPQRVVGVLSCLTTSCLISGFGAPPSWCVFLSLQENTHPVSFVTAMLITQQQGVLAQQISLQSLLLVDLILYSILRLSLPRLVSSPIDLPLTDFFRFHFLFLPCPCWVLILWLLCSTVVSPCMLTSA